MFDLAGAVGMSSVLGVIVLVALRSAGLNHPDQHAARYGLRLGLGIVLVVTGSLVAARQSRSAAGRESSIGSCPEWSWLQLAADPALATGPPHPPHPPRMIPALFSPPY